MLTCSKCGKFIAHPGAAHVCESVGAPSGATKAPQVVAVSGAVVPERDGVDPTRYCAPDEVWMCGACGKTAEFDRYGSEGKHSYGWDVSCMLNAHKVKRPTAPIQESTAPASPTSPSVTTGISPPTT